MANFFAFGVGLFFSRLAGFDIMPVESRTMFLQITKFIEKMFSKFHKNYKSHDLRTTQ